MLLLDLAEKALSDIDDISVRTLEKHGLEAYDRYEHLIKVALRQLREDPKRIGVHETTKGYWKYHLSWSKNDTTFGGRIVRDPKHYIIFRVVADNVLEVVRVLHERMDFNRQL